MATVKGTIQDPTDFARLMASVIQQSAAYGQTIHKQQLARCRNESGRRFLEAQFRLLNDGYKKLTIPDLVNWRDPFGPAAWSRTNGEEIHHNSWVNYTMAHFGEAYYRGDPISSDPTQMPNAVATATITAVNWALRTFTTTVTFHYYTPATPEESLWLFQIRPRSIGKPWQMYSTRLIFLYADISKHPAAVTFDSAYVFEVNPGQTLAVAVRLRTKGGHDLAKTASFTRPY